ncbi:MAG: DUF5606 domain-containing protein [Bacteroidia bacterium]
MELKDVVSVAGKPGLHKIIGKGASGLVLEALDESAKRTITPLSQKVSILEDISVYTIDGDVKLADVFLKIEELDKAGNFTSLTKDASGDAIKKWFETILANFDKERVYNSDIQKVSNWYNMLKGKIDFSAKPEIEDAENPDKAASKTKTIKPVKKVEAKKVKPSKGATKTAITSRKMS